MQSIQLLYQGFHNHQGVRVQVHCNLTTTYQAVKNVFEQQQKEKMGSRSISRAGSYATDAKLLSVQFAQIPTVTVSDFKIRVLNSLAKLSNKDVAKKGNEELIGIIETLDYLEPSPSQPQLLQVLMSCLWDVNESQTALYKKEVLKIINAVALARKDEVQPYLGKIAHMISHFLKDKDTNVREACSETLGVVCANVSPSQKQDSLGVYFKSLLKHLNEQWGACMCITAVITNSPVECVAEYAGKLFEVLKKQLSQSGCLSAPIMLLTLTNLMKVLKGESLVFLDSFLQLSLDALASEDWNLRKAGVEGLGIVAMTLNEELLPFQEQILQALDGMKSDKMKVVRDVAKEVIPVVESLGSLSEMPTKRPPSRGGLNHIPSPGPKPVLRRSPPGTKNSFKPKYLKGVEESQTAARQRLVKSMSVRSINPRPKIPDMSATMRDKSARSLPESPIHSGQTTPVKGARHPPLHRTATTSDIGVRRNRSKTIGSTDVETIFVNGVEMSLEAAKDKEKPKVLDALKLEPEVEVKLQRRISQTLTRSSNGDLVMEADGPPDAQKDRQIEINKQEENSKSVKPAQAPQTTEANAVYAAQISNLAEQYKQLMTMMQDFMSETRQSFQQLDKRLTKVERLFSAFSSDDKS